MGQVIEMRRRYGGRLPYDAEIEYLEADGDSYIDTGLKILNGVSGTIRLQVKGVITGYKSDIINDNVVADLIPVRRGDVGYMYDKVSRQLFGNAGTGTFVVGPDVVGVVVTRCNIGVYVALGEERRAA